MRLSRFLIAGLPALIVALTAMTPAAEARLVCKSMVWGYGLHANKNTSKLYALGDWKTNAKNQYGAGFSNYDKAKSKSHKCRRKGSKQHCVVKGRPCKTDWSGSDKESG
ncbi:MAG: hypothetical protein ACR2PM_07665 [Hyphomicrobiales bacterium]